VLLVGWLIGWLVNWMFGCLIDWWIDWLINWLIDWSIDVQVVVGPDGMGSRQPALMGAPGAMWLGGTVSQKDSKHKGMQKPIADGRLKPPHKVSPSTHLLLETP